MSQTNPSPDPPSERTGSTQMRAVVCLDLVDSTALIERLGDARGAELIRRHDRLVRDLTQRHGGQEIDKTDGFLLLFERAIDATAFAIAYQRDLGALQGDDQTRLKARVGIHVGEVVLWRNAATDVARGAKPIEVEGLAKPIAARLSALALPSQTLLSEHTYQLSRRAAAELPASERVNWCAHGRYRFKGVSEPMPVFEVGESGIAPLHAPASSDKAEREVPLWRQPRVVAIEALGLMLTVVAIGYGLLRESPAIAFAERDWVVVGHLDNHSGETLFDDALDTALRVSLEQSRHVNVVPDMQIADALRRMNLKDAVVDRRVGVELAVREGARAFLLPSVTQVGGRTRFNVAVIDPKTGATVYSEGADSRTLGDMLPAVDAVVGDLRRRLGESLASIEARSEPLEKVTTGNLEALKAYSLAIKALASGDTRNVVTLLNRAVELDPQFATAYTKLAAIWYAADLPERMREALAKASAYKDRLSERERLYLEAMVAGTQSPEAARERWTQLATLYPDFLIGQQNLASFYWMIEYRYAQAQAQYEALVQSRHPLRGISMQNDASVMIGLGRFADAAALLDRATELGAANLYDARVDLALAQRHYTGAFDALTADLGRENPQTLFWKGLRRIAVLADQGRAEAAMAAIDSLRDNPTIGMQPLYVARLDLARLSLLAQWRPAQLDPALGDFVERNLAGIDTGDIAFTDTRPSMLLIAALIAARTERTDIARKVRAALAPHLRQPQVYERLALLDALNTELAREGIATGPTETVPATLFDGRTLYLRELAHARLALAQGDAHALARLVDLCEQRQLGIAEFGAGFALLVPNILASNQTCMQANTAAASTQPEVAARARRTLDAVWKNADADWPGRDIATGAAAGD